MKAILSFFLLIGLFSWGQDGTPDLSFGDDGLLILPLTENPIEEGICNLWGVAENSNGDIISLAKHVDINTTYLVSVLEDGTLNSSFGTDGFLTLPINEEFTWDALHINDADQFLIAYKDGSTNTLMRLNSNGSLDSTFGTNGLLTFTNSSEFYQIRYWEDAIFYQATKFINGIFNVIIEKYTSDGVMDPSFGTNGIFEMPLDATSSSIVRDIRVIADGSLLVSHSQSSGGEYMHYISKIAPSGSLDSSYGNDGTSVAIPVGQEYFLQNILAYPNGSVLGSFQFWDMNLEDYLYKIVKLTPEGILDTSFGSQGYYEGRIASLLQENGRIITALPSYDWEGGFYIGYGRNFSDGYPDPSFTYLAAMWGPFGEVYAKLLNDGKFLVAGDRAWYDTNPWIILQKFNNNPLDIPDFESQQIMVSPNPSDGLFQLKFDSFSQNSMYSIVDISGKQIQTGTITDQNATLDLSLVEAGMYFLHLGDTTLKLIKN